MDSSKRILNQLEHGRGMSYPTATRQGRRQVVYALGVVAAVVVLAAGVVGMGTDGQPHPAGMADPLAAAAAASPAPAAASKEDERLAAAIVNEPLERHVASQTRSTAGTMPATRPGLARAPGIGAGAGSSRAATQATAAAVAEAPRRPARGPAAGAAERGDSDVALLAALMAHANGETAVEHPLAARLRLCARLAGNEAALCHARACTGHWGRDRACRITARE